MRIFRPIVFPATHLATVQIAQCAHRCRAGSQPIRDARFGTPMPFQRLFQELQSCGFVTLSGNVRFQDLTLMVHRTPQVMSLAVDLYEHLIKVPAPVSNAPHSADPLPADVCGKQRSEPVPPEPHRLVTNINAALEKQIFNIPQAQREPHAHHYHQSDHLWRRVETAERVRRLAHLAVLPAPAPPSKLL